MEKLNFNYPATGGKPVRAEVGVVASGDLEVLLEPSKDNVAHVAIETSVGGFSSTWKAVLDRFFERYDKAASITIHDFGATPGTVALRLQQVVEVNK